MREVSLERFAAARVSGAEVIDVREPDEYEAGHVPGARLIPLGQVPSYAHEIDCSRPVYVICASGNRSKTATDVLCRAGVDAYSVAGGTRAWIESGRPSITGTHVTVV